MENDGAVFTIRLFLTLSVHLSSAGTHTLQYLNTEVTSGGNFTDNFTAVGLLDEDQFLYNNNIEELKLKAEWVKKLRADDSGYWNTEEHHVQLRQDGLDLLAKVVQGLTHAKGVDALQRMCGCEHDDNGTTRGYDQFGYDGEDFISLDLNTGSWTAVKNESVSVINQWDPKGHQAKHWKNYLENDCIDLLKKFVFYAGESLDRNVPPNASVFLKHSPSPPELVCHSTGFFPKAVMIYWQKDGEDVQEDVELRETLPNQDGSFQKRSVLKVPAEELQKHTYTCIIQHSSLEKEKVLQVPKGGENPGVLFWVGFAVGFVVGIVVVFALVLTLCWLRNRPARKEEVEGEMETFL